MHRESVGLEPRQSVRDCILIERPPTLEEYRALRDAVGWGNGDPEAAQIGLRNALFSVCVVGQGGVIGCGRIVGDGGTGFYVQDIIVLPAYHGYGLGRRIMDAVMAYISIHARPAPSSASSLPAVSRP
jgi:ribosomal protein S18 acetylase RimI-like enzyme